MASLLPTLGFLPPELLETADLALQSESRLFSRHLA
jgi:hypothetical protein